MVAAETVEVGDHVVLDENRGGKLSVVQVTKKTRVKVGKAYCSLLPLVGKKYGTVFQLAPDGRELVVGSEASIASLNGTSSAVSIDKSNKDLLDDGTAQKLSKEDIEKLKGEGLQGTDIIEKLVENSATFSAKTEFSQDKYKRKKQKKYCAVLMLCRPCVRTVCEAYFQKSPARICGLRVDTLGLLLGMANVSAHSKTLVLEESAGLVLASVLERMGGFGEVCATSLGPRPPMDIVRFFNFDETITECSKFAPMAELLGARSVSNKPTEAEPAEAEPVETKGNGDNTAERDAAAEGVDSMAEDKTENKLESETALDVAAAPQVVESVEGSKPTTDPSDRPQKLMKTEHRGNNSHQGSDPPRLKRVFFPKKATKEQVALWARSGFSSVLVVAPKISPEWVMQKVMRLTAPSGNFAVFSPWLQPLVECRVMLQKKKLAVAIQITETFWREHQVLPGRSHPHMVMTTGPSSGFILSGIATEEVLKLP